MEKTNIAELLRDCPKDMELDCMMYEDVYFDYVDELNIIHCYIKHKGFKTSITFNQHGTPNSDIKSKCVLFPKGKTTWKGFVPSCKFKDGDIVATMTGSWIGITAGGNTHSFIPTYCVIKYNGEFEAYFDIKKEWCFSRLATEEERQRLFDVLKECGYRWHTETKTLEKLPKFKVGDKIRHKKNKTIINTISYIYSNGYVLCDGYLLFFKEENEWELVPVEPKFRVGDRIKWAKTGSIYEISKILSNCYIAKYLGSDITILFDKQDEFELVPIKPKFKVGDRVKNILTHVSGIVVKVTDKGYHIEYSKAGGFCYINFELEKEYELAPNKFDITTLKPFESKVLVRHHETSIWMPAVFGGYDILTLACYMVGGTWWKYCIPYKGNEHLRGTTADCNNYYKTWE